ncbi:MAG: PIN domain-containing protein [Rhodospirillaceae bacterium]|nr:PIN domain-containing protein [Rhodospirillaceae bacterium]MYK14511.1 PIN domain-containing protein [Rhodospirillaceae bacterium]
MCAIVDANVVWEVFGSDRPEAGQKFFDWLTAGSGILIIGGRLLSESSKDLRFKKWAEAAVKSGRMKIEDGNEIDRRKAEISRIGQARSNDVHIVALAQISGARLLYSNDRKLIDDFKDKSLIDRPRGKVYRTSDDPAFTPSKRALLASKTLCRSKE